MSPTSHPVTPESAAPRPMDYYLTLLSFGDKGWGDELARGASITISPGARHPALRPCAGPPRRAAEASGQRRSCAAIGTVYVTVFRGLPELLTLYIVYFGTAARPAEGVEGPRLHRQPRDARLRRRHDRARPRARRVLLRGLGRRAERHSTRASARAPLRSASPSRLTFRLVVLPATAARRPARPRQQLDGAAEGDLAGLRHRAARPDVLDRAGQRGDQGAVPVLRRGLPDLPLLLARLRLRHRLAGAPRQSRLRRRRGRRTR